MKCIMSLIKQSPMLVCVLFSGTVAHKIMQKYGFRDGQGLGKHEQGLSTALSVEKTSKRGGKIIIGDSTEKSEIIYTHTHSQAHSKYVQTHTSQVQNKHPLDLLLCFSVSCLFSTPFLSFAQPCCTTHLNVCVCFSIRIQSECGCSTWLYFRFDFIYFLFPISVIYL